MQEHHDMSESGLDAPIRSGEDGKQLRIKLARLRDIESVMVAWARGELPPHPRNVLLASSLAFAAAFLFAWGVPLSASLTVSLTAACAAVVGIFVGRMDTSARTHPDHLDALLNRYEPVSKEAYRILQLQVKERGAITRDVVACWLASERQAIQFVSGWRMPSLGHFLKRKV